MNQSKIFLASLLLLTSTTWAQPDEYLQDVEDSPTSMTALFEDSAVESKPTLVATTEEVTAEPVAVKTVPVQTTTRARKANRGIASVAEYDCAGVSQKINKGETLSKKEMSSYTKNCK
ncbi:hypothetical protein K2P97_07340 [bacterium]|nr:hypothetical protein [bacterium]